MPFKPLVTAGIENVLNAFLYRAPALKAARQRLNGKVLRIVLKEFSTPLVLVFSERQLDVLGEWEGEADCSVITHMSVLPKLRDRQQLTALIRSGELEVEGDIQVVQNFVALSDLAEFAFSNYIFSQQCCCFYLSSTPNHFRAFQMPSLSTSVVI